MVTKRIRLWLMVASMWWSGSGWAALVLEPMEVRGERFTSAEVQRFGNVEVIAADAQSAAGAGIDRWMRASPSFALFRRSDATVVNPTASGVSLRGLAPSGASRSLVLFGGVPAVDPFGGWVPWLAYGTLEVGQIELASGLGAQQWGSGALSGVIALLPRALEARGGAVSATLDHLNGRSAEVLVDERFGDAYLRLGGRSMRREAGWLLRASERGAVDRRPSVEAEIAHARLEHRGAVDFGAGVRWLEEKRGNGTAYQENATRRLVADVSMAGGDESEFRWGARAYAQDQEYSSTFSSVRPGRDEEVPSADQTAVPAEAVGVGVEADWTFEAGVLSLVADARSVDGETRELFLWDGVRFLRERRAGGVQTTYGAGLGWVGRQGDLTWTIATRVDEVRNTGGFRWERVVQTGQRLRSETYAEQTDPLVSPSLGVSWEPDSQWRIYGRLGRSHRSPTLNERYRPFRTATALVEANPGLGTERFDMAEIGVEHRWRTGGSVALSAFSGELEDGVVAVTRVRGPNSDPRFGFLPAGVVGRLRENLPRIDHSGMTLRAEYPMTGGLRGSLGVQRLESTIVEAPTLALEGKRLAQVPDWTLTGQLVAEPTPMTWMAASVRWSSASFEDDENEQLLAAGGTLDLEAGWHILERTRLTIGVENVTESQVQLGRTPEGLVQSQRQRRLWMSVEHRW